MKRVDLPNAERRLASVAVRARQETSPLLDVTDAVMHRLRRMRVAYAPERPMLWMTAGAIAAAAIVMTISMPYLAEALDPLTLFLEEAASSAI